MTKLLHKPLKLFALYALIVLACSIPAYYFIIDSIWNEETDERNEIVSEQIARSLNNIESDTEFQNAIKTWNKMQVLSSIHLANTQPNLHDSVYKIQREITEDGHKEMEHFRGLYKRYTLHGASYNISVETNIEEAEDTVLAIALITSVFTFILIAGLVYLNTSISKKIWRPFYETIDQLKKIDLSKYEKTTFPQSDIEEFKTLNSSLEKMIDKNLAVFENQKEFTQNASHELQTPLALAKSKIDLLIQSPDLTDLHRKTIDDLNSSLSRMTRINKNLLLLSNIENMELTKQQLRIDVILENLYTSFDGHIIQRKIHLRKIIERGFVIAASESLLEILLNNLLSNAIRHNIENGIIIVKLDSGILSIKSTGDRPLNRDHLFKRFVSADAAKGNSGLGLAIAKEISDKHGWLLDYSFEETLHVLSVNFKIQN